MEELEASGAKHAKARVEEEFPAVFMGVYAADIEKARYWWQRRATYLQDSLKTISARITGGRNRVNLKVIAGRGRKREEWVTYVWCPSSCGYEPLGLRLTTLCSSRLHENNYCSQPTTGKQRRSFAINN
jgi:hypothetical protein